MPPAGSYRITVTDKATGAFIDDYPVKSDGSILPKKLALETAVFDGRFKTLADAKARTRCLIVSRPKTRN